MAQSRTHSTKHGVKNETKFYWTGPNPTPRDEWERSVVVLAAIQNFPRLWLPYEDNSDDNAPWKCKACGRQMAIARASTATISIYFWWCRCGLNGGPDDAATWNAYRKLSSTT